MSRAKKYIGVGVGAFAAHRLVRRPLEVGACPQPQGQFVHDAKAGWIVQGETHDAIQAPSRDECRRATADPLGYGVAGVALIALGAAAQTSPLGVREVAYGAGAVLLACAAHSRRNQ